MRDAKALRSLHKKEERAEGTLDDEVAHEVPWNGIFGERDGAGYKSQGLVDQLKEIQGHTAKKRGLARVEIS